MNINVQRYMAGINVAASGTQFDSEAVKLRGIITRLIVVVPNFTNNITVAISILNDIGDTLYSVSGLSKNATHNMAIDIEAVGNLIFRANLSGDAGSAGTIGLRIYERS